MSFIQTLIRIKYVHKKANKKLTKNKTNVPNAPQKSNCFKYK